jgi:hypothetical protein
MCASSHLTTQTNSVKKDLVGSTASASENAQTDLAFKQYWISTKLPECLFVAEKPLLMFAHRRALAWEVDDDPQ